MEEYTTVPAVLRVKHNRIKAARESGTEDRLAVFCNQRLRRHAAAPAACQPITAQPVAALLLWWRRGGVAALAQTFRPAQQPRVLVNAPPAAALLAFWAAGSRRRHLLVRAAAAVALAGREEIRARWEAAAVAADAVILVTALLHGRFLIRAAAVACLARHEECRALWEAASVTARPVLGVLRAAPLLRRRRWILLIRAAAEVAVAGHQEVGSRVEAAAIAAHALWLSTALILVHVAHAACLRGADGVLCEGAAVHALPAAACLSVTAHALCLAARLWGRRGLIAAPAEDQGARNRLVRVGEAVKAAAEAAFGAAVVNRRGGRWGLVAAVALGGADP